MSKTYYLINFGQSQSLTCKKTEAMLEHFILELPGTSAPIRMEISSGNLWKSAGSNLLELGQTQDGVLQVINKDSSIEIDDEYLIEIFAKQKAEQEKRIIDEEISGVETDLEEANENEETIPRPNFDPEQIRVDFRIFSLFDVVRFIDTSRIDLSPDFQRHFAWKVIQQSRLIESLLLRIPLPVFYLSEDGDGMYQVVDGLHRLTTIHQFIKSKLRLKGLEYLWDDCEGKAFDGLLPKYQRRLEETPLTFNIIAPTTPVSAKFEIFKRINEGGKPLNRQEIRNSMAKPGVRAIINKLASSEEFKQATDHSIKPVRMEDQELVLRYVGFYLNRFKSAPTYKGEMESFLDETLDYLNQKASGDLLATIEEGFFQAMRNATHLFGRYAFRKVTSDTPENSRRSLINKSLFTVWSVLLSQIDEQHLRAHFESGCLVPVLAQQIRDDAKYLAALTIGTNQSNKIEYSFRIAKEIIAQITQPVMSHA